MTIDSILTKYAGMYEELRKHMSIIERGEIPHADSEGAPETLGEAQQAILGMAFIVDQVMNDLLEMKMEEVYEASE